MSHIHFGLEREKSIIAVFLLTPFLSSSLLRRAVFPEASLQMAQRVLKRMTDRGMLKRFRYGQEYIYHIAPKNKKWRHWLEVARFHYAMLEGLANWQEIIDYKIEHDLGFAVADLYYKMVYKPGDVREVYVEIDMGSHPIKFDKYPPSYHVLLVTPRKVNPPANWRITTIEEVRVNGIRLGNKSRPDDVRWFQDAPEKSEEKEKETATRGTFFQ